MDTTVRDPLVGRVLDERYEVRSRIARGGMATIYAGLDRRLDRQVALKIMHPHLADDEEFVSRFVREARSAARLSHPNVVQVFDQGSDGEVLYLAMELLPGRTLRDVITERGALTPREALTVLEPMLDGLGAAHRAGFVHRDVKPENVILTDEGRVKVADFGLARAISGRHTQTGALIGTVAYLAPELVTRGMADARSDVYAAGIVLFEMLTGRQPFVGEVPMQVAYRHVHEDVPKPSSLVPELPSEIDDLVTSAVARDAEDRPADAGEWLQAVRRVRAELTDEILDTRPDVAAQVAPSGGRPNDGGSQTELVAPSTNPNPTQTLPQLGGLRSLRERSRREASEAGDDHVAVELGSIDEDAALRRMVATRRRRGLIGLLAVFAITVSLSLGAWWLVAGPGAFTVTPSLANLTAEEAQAVAAADGLEVRVENGDYSDTVPKGQILRTDPGSGERIRRHGSISVYVSMGTAKRKVPKVVGMTLEQATAAIEKAGLEVSGAAQEVNHDTIEAGRVVASAPGSGSEQALGSGVGLQVSTGPADTVVPDVYNVSPDEARKKLEEAGLQVTVVEEERGDVPPGTVLNQQPGPNETVPRRSTVNLTISKAPGGLVMVPNVLGWNFDDAEQHLSGLGFEVDRRGGGIFGTVQTQKPDPGTQVDAGSKVTLRGI